MTREKAIKIVKEFINGTCLHLVDQEALKTLIPELKENEGERIRKEIIKFIQDFCNPCDPDCDKWIAYLEKQKEEEGYEAIPVESTLEYKLGFKAGKESEKQKEQEPAEFTHHEIDESLQDAVTHQMEDDGDVDDFVRRGIDDIALKYAELGAKWQKEQKPTATINGEPIPTENYSVDIPLAEWSEEDERIRKEIYNFFKNFKETGTWKSISDVNTWLAYLEKQKEQIPYTDFVIKPHKGDDNNPYDMRVSEAQEYAIKRGFGVPFNDGEVYVDERHMTQTIGNILRWADEHPKEQKPVDYEAELKKCKDNPLYFYDKYVSIKQKPTEWSEKDKKLIDDVINSLCCYQNTLSDYQKEIVGEEIRKLKSLKPQPKQEWSEEDERMLSRCIKSIETSKQFADSDTFKVAKDKEIAWLKSLRPQYHGDVTMTEAYKMGLEAGKASSWKPSKEQMEALLNTLHPDDPYYHDLKSLYEHLNKLM